MALEIGCACETGNGNTGLPDCKELFGVAKGLGVMNIVAKDGTVNRIDLSVASIGTTFVDLLKNADRSKRLFPITEIRNITFPKEDNQYATDSSGQKVEVRSGIQSFMGEVWEVPPAFDAKLQQSKCPRNGSYIFSMKGVQGIRRYDSTDNKYYFYPIEMRAFAPYYVPQVDADPSKEMIPFDFAPTVVVGELWTVTWADLGTTYEEMVGLLDVNYKVIDAVAASLGTTTVGLRLNTDYGQGLDNTTTQNVDGKVTGDFTGLNVTTGLALTSFTATEVVDDKYTFSWDTETSSDVIRISINLSTGYEGHVDVVEP